MRVFPLGCLFAGALVVAPASWADRIVLANGDRLTGKVLQKGNDTLTLETDYAGKIKLPWSKVVEITTDQPVEVVLVDETSLKATMNSPEAGKVVLKSGKLIQTTAIDLGKVAYINPPPHVSGKGVELSGKANIGITETRGNTESGRTYVDAEMVARTKSNRYTIGLIVDRAQENGQDTVSNTTGYMKYDHFFREKWYMFGNATLTEDKFKDLNLRTALSVGVGHQFRESKEINLSLEGGIAYVNEDFIVADDESYAAGRWAVKYDQLFLGGKTQFFHEHEGLLSLEDTDDIVVRSRTGLRFPLVNGLNSAVQVNADWDNSPPPGTDATDLTYILKFGYAW